MRYLSLFSGIEAATQAWQPLGWECVAVSEIEPFPCAVLEHHYPNVPNLGDVTKITEQQIKDLGQIDLIVFGSPCQNLSIAGNRKGFEGSESSLFYAAMEIIKYAKRHCKTRFALWENVPGAFSSNKGADFTEVVKHMAGLSDLDTPKNGWGKEGAAVGDNGLLEWSVLDAQWFGLAQRRKRVFAIVDFGDWQSRPPILLERESLRGDSAPSRETREGTAADVRGCLKARAFTPVSSCLYAAYGTKWNGNGAAYDGSLFALQPKKAVYSFDSLSSNSMKSKNPHSDCRQVELAKCLDTSNDCPSKNQGGLAVVAIAGNIIGRTDGSGGNGNGFDKSGACYTLTTNDRHAVAYGFEPGITAREGNPNRFSSEVTPTLRANMGDNQVGVAYGFATKQMGLDLTQECGNTLCANDFKEPQAVFQPSSVVRRLTPIECERLQGFPDDFTKIPYRNKPADDCPNGPRYKALGNSMAVNVMAWIGQSISSATSNKENYHEH